MDRRTEDEGGRAEKKSSLQSVKLSNDAGRGGGGGGGGEDGAEEAEKFRSIPAFKSVRVCVCVFLE